MDDRVNRDAAKYIRASAAEEAVLGIMLIYEDMRHKVATDQTLLSASDFSTAFGKRLFEVLCELDLSEFGYSKAMLGQYFGADEMGKIENIEQVRRSYTRNDLSVLEASIAALKEEKQKNFEQMDTKDMLENLRRINLQKKQNNK